jgi:hypothetical protein
VRLSCFCGRYQLEDGGSSYVDSGDRVHTERRCGAALDMSDAYHRLRGFTEALEAGGAQLQQLYASDPVVHALVEWGRQLEAQRPTGTVGVQLAVADVRTALRGIPLTSPAHQPGTEPTAADACKQLLEMIEHCLRSIESFT